MMKVHEMLKLSYTSKKYPLFIQDLNSTEPSQLSGKPHKHCFILLRKCSCIYLEQATHHYRQLEG